MNITYVITFYAKMFSGPDILERHAVPSLAYSAFLYK